MRFLALFSCALFVGLAGGETALAQVSKQTAIPAEFPPSSFTGRQYVDSRGCIYIRAGYGGTVQWVPRVSRDRKHICNARPTAIARAEPQPKTKTAAMTPVVPKPVATVPTQRRVVSSAPKRRSAQRLPARVAAATTTGATAVKRPARLTRAVTRPVVKTTRRVASACSGLSPISAQYLRGEGVRCGPQPLERRAPTRQQPAAKAAAVPALTAWNGMGPDAKRVAITPQTRVAPRHVAQTEAQYKDLVPVPKGYRTVWEDDRLNPYRAQQTMTGKAMTDYRWTQTTPRELIYKRPPTVSTQNNFGTFWRNLWGRR